MIVRDLKEIYQLTSQVTGIPIYKVTHAVRDGEFQFLKEWLADPDKPAVFFNEFGRFELYLSTITRMLKFKWIPILRETKSELAKEKFNHLWKLRKKALNYILNKRIKKRHN